ncbi:MAG: RNA-binding S4 domain-containing protein [Bacillota bacterium]|nr:RNA-binding S4 domain-containing protein [Bacillota bacterium]
MDFKKITIKTATIKLDQFLKWADIVGSGGEAKMIIKDEQVKLNGEIITQRGKVLTKGDIITVEGINYQVEN